MFYFLFYSILLIIENSLNIELENWIIGHKDMAKYKILSVLAIILRPKNQFPISYI